MVAVPLRGRREMRLSNMDGILVGNVQRDEKQNPGKV